MATLYLFPTLPRIREQVREVMQTDDAIAEYAKALREFRAREERDRRTAEQMRGYDQWERNHPNSNPPKPAA